MAGLSLIKYVCVTRNKLLPTQELNMGHRVAYVDVWGESPPICLLFDLNKIHPVRKKQKLKLYCLHEFD